VLCDPPVSSVRELIGLVNRLAAAADARGAPLDARVAREELGLGDAAAATVAPPAARTPRRTTRSSTANAWSGTGRTSAAASSRSSLVAIRGSLKEASLPDVLQLLAMGKKSGCLSVTHRSNFGSIYFDKGKISFASIVNRRDRLGDILVKSGLLPQAQLDEAITLQGRSRGRRLGEILVEQEMLTREQLHAQIRIQIEEAVYFLFTWAEGTFNFEADIRPEEQDFLVSINPESLLLEGARRVDEWSLIEKKVPSFDLVFELDRRRLADSGATLTTEQQALLPLIDGRRDVAALVDASGMVEFEVGKALFGLASAGFLHRVGKTKPAAEVAADVRIEEHRNLGVAFYKTGMLDEAVREFRRVTELRPDDLGARFFLGLAHLRLGKWADALSQFEAASAAARRPVVGVPQPRARARAARPARRSACGAGGGAARGGEDDPRIHLSLGMLALRAGEFDAADAHFMRARPLFGDACTVGRVVPLGRARRGALGPARQGDRPPDRRLRRASACGGPAQQPRGGAHRGWP
jgi:Flp pilus assembly protein TadD